MASWRFVKQTNKRYIVSDEGDVMNLNFGGSGEPGILSQSGTEGKPKKTSVCIDGKMKRVDIHRLVAEAFLENPDPSSYKYVKHKGNIHDNRAENLYWDTWC